MSLYASDISLSPILSLGRLRDRALSAFKPLAGLLPAYQSIDELSASSCPMLMPRRLRPATFLPMLENAEMISLSGDLLSGLRECADLPEDGLARCLPRGDAGIAMLEARGKSSRMGSLPWGE